MKVAKDYKAKKNLIFVGLTNEGKNSMNKTKAWLKKLGVPWIVGLGSKSLETYKIRYFPTTMVIGKNGKIAWTDTQGGSVETAIEKALAAE